MKRSVIHLSIVFALLLGGVMTANAEDAAATATTEVEVEAAPMPVYGLQLWKDAETGELRGPTAEEAAEISKLMHKMFGAQKAAPKVVAHKNGMTSIELDPSMLEFSMVHKTADGQLVTHCVDDAHHVHEFLGQSTKTTGPAEE